MVLIMIIKEKEGNFPQNAIQLIPLVEPAFYC